MIQAVIFDRDGILINSEEIHVLSTLNALKKLGITSEYSDRELIIGRHPAEYGIEFMKKYSNQGFSYDSFRVLQKELYYATIDNAPLFEDTIQLVKLIHESNIPLGLTTSSSKDNTTRFLNLNNLTRYFDVVITFEDCDKRKPDPAPYILTAHRLRVDPKYCIAIEDTAIGVESAKCAGMKCIAIPNGYTANQDFSKADAVVDSAKGITLSFLEALMN